MTERLACESDGTVVVASGQPACPTLTVAAERWWQIEVQAPSQPWQSGEVRGADATGRPPRVEPVAEGVRLVWDSLGDELPFCAIGLEVLVS
ncbi:MAG: hypothetical protein HUU35_20030, partial [Armatimonadetes bacterium]|nr:hypothetical protein [Armatimonadota bacterium]